MEEFKKVLGELQQAYVSQMMSPAHKPGLSFCVDIMNVELCVEG